MFTSDFGLGTLISNLSNRYGTGKYLRERLTQERRANYGDDLMARTEAWKAAGLHPLVGMQIPMDGPMVGYSSSAPAPRFQWSPDAKVDPDTARLRKAQADLAEIQVKEAQRRLSGQPGNQGGGVVQTEPVGGVKPEAAQTGQFQVQPSSITSVSRSIPFQTAGPAGAFESRYGYRNPVTGNVQYGNIPSKDVSEPLEGMGEVWKGILGTPLAGKFIWDVMMPDEWKAVLFDSIERGLKNLSRKSGRSTGFGSGSALK